MSGLVYISPANVFWRICKRGSTEEFESIPYVSKLLNAYFWIYYGLIKPDSLLVATVNMFGAVVEIIFLTIFLLFAPPRMKVNLSSSSSSSSSSCLNPFNLLFQIRTAILVVVLDVVFPAAAILCTHFLLHGDTRIDVAGLLCVAFSMVAYASPLSAIKTLLLTKSVEYMPFLLSFILFLNGGVWTAYALLAKDLFVGLPNGTGFFLGTLQLILYAIYWKPKSSRRIVDDLEHQDKREPLIKSSEQLQQDTHTRTTMVS
ncbi:Bidirectional sugar transporter SWEET17 [Morus notabilis]|uniref:Bidirectional sugar transporter SWEET n=1 Tax=Morus notabilis TaxID=981085 RepID=W9RR83_9ROSA|nr:Bidirectional sugar transporter SWEET17 [Morus notabilis]